MNTVINSLTEIKDDEGVWYIAKDISKLLGYRDAHCLSRRLNNKEKKTIKYNTNGGIQNVLVINKDAIIKTISNSRKMSAIELANTFGINTIHNFFVPQKEQDSLDVIRCSFKNYRSIEQFRVDNYRVDLYFPDLKLVVECDEFGHKDRSIQYENERQKFIENKLQCKFIRFNPDNDEFNIGIIINKILLHIEKNKLHN